MQKVSVKDVFDIQFLSDVNMSPDGKHAAFVVSTGNIEDNGYKSNIWLYELGSGNLRQLTALDSEKNITWLDNEHLIFPTMRDAKDKERAKKGEFLTAYYTINIHGGEARKSFVLPLKSGVLKKVGEDSYLTAAVFDNCLPDFSAMNEAEREKTMKKLKEEMESFTIFDEIPFWLNGKGIVNKRRNRLYLCDTHNNTQTPISPPLMNVMGYKVDDSGNKVIYHGVEYDSIMERKSILHVYDMKTSTDIVIPLGEDFSIDIAEIIGDQIVFYGLQTARLNSCNNSKFFKVSLNGGKPELLADMDISLGGVGSDCKYGSGNTFRRKGNVLYYVSSRGYSSYLFKLEMDGKETLVSRNVTGSVDSFDLVGDQAVFIGARDKGLTELYMLSLNSGEEKRGTEFNKAWLEGHDISYPEHFLFKNRDGVELDGFIIKPVGYEENKTYPAILDIHGGPKSIYGDILFHEMQLWASEGYFVFYTNPRGSDGRGSEFANIIGERYCNWDYNDLMDFTDEVLKRQPQIDQKRVGVTGGSYGGLMTNWIVGHTSRFAAAATQRSISNFISKCLTTDIGYYHNLAQMETDPWQEQGAGIMWDHSPLKYVDQCKTPLLFIHSDEDYRCYMADAFQMFTALKMFGIDTRLCLFHGENHDLSRSGKPKNRMKRLQEITDWMNKYLKA